MALLISKNEAENPRIVPLGNAVLFIGRDSSSGIYIDASEISRNHASISFVDGKYILKDNGSTNGSFLNGNQTSEGVLAHGDEIRFTDHVDAVDRAQQQGKLCHQPALQGGGIQPAAGQYHLVVGVVVDP